MSSQLSIYVLDFSQSLLPAVTK